MVDPLEMSLAVFDYEFIGIIIQSLLHFNCFSYTVMILNVMTLLKSPEKNLNNVSNSELHRVFIVNLNISHLRAYAIL